ncbi:MAG TPA: peptide-binding protein, partial [bacterium]|nr:peptide-binding protein [bacterium]
LEWAAFLDKLYNRDFDVVTLACTMPFEADPYQVWDMSQANIKSSSNYISYVNVEASKLMREAREEFDEEKRNVKYRLFHKIIHEEQPYTFLYNQPNIIAVSKRFGNVKTHPAGLELREWTVRNR